MKNILKEVSITFKQIRLPQFFSLPLLKVSDKNIRPEVFIAHRNVLLTFRQRPLRFELTLKRIYLLSPDYPTAQTQTLSVLLGTDNLCLKDLTTARVV